MNPSETFVNRYESSTDDKIIKNKNYTSSSQTTHWITETGILDIFLLPGPNIYQQYASLTGQPYLAPTFALRYHQFRWNYQDEQDTLAVHANFEKYEYPYNVLWIDIEHTDGKNYFTWYKHNFPNPMCMQSKKFL